MFKSALLRLTGLYLLIVMIISLFFSATIYQLASREFGKGFREQAAILDYGPNNFPINLRETLKQNRLDSLEEARSSLLASLVFTNLAILILGGGLSYILAKRTLEPIEDAHRSLEQFTADASHEIRTPLAAMKSEIEVALMNKTISDKESRQLLGSNLEEIDDLTKLTEDLLRLARLEESRLELQKMIIKPIIENSVKKLQTASAAKKVSIKVDYNKAEIAAIFDARSLKEVLIILLDNAVKYSDPSSSVEVKVYKKRDKVEIAITNTGMHISKDELPRIFDRLYRSNKSRTKGSEKGHGLGLSIAKQLIEAQGGLIKVNSKDSKTTFIVLLTA